jgi:hypothetical protein
MAFRNGNNNGKLKLLLIVLATIIIVGIVIYLLWKKGYLAKAKAKIDKYLHPNGVIEPAPEESCTFPVSLNSSPGCIITAMEKSGYIQAQKQWWIDQTGDLETVGDFYGGMTGTQYIANIYKDPVTDLRSHPYVYSMYPQWFKQVS